MMSEESKGTLIRYCKMCAKLLAPDYEREYCPACEENKLFDEVREYIRNNEVTEHQVADHFRIPQKLVKNWIKEGRIEYKESAEAKELVMLHCEQCGTPLTFGTLCRKCRKMAENAKYEYVGNDIEDIRMRFLDKDDK